MRRIAAIASLCGSERFQETLRLAKGSNIVEASRQSSRREFARFLRYALNSASELEYHLILARDIGATPETETSALIEDVTEVRKMLHGLLRRLTTVKRSDGSATATSTPV